VEIERAPVDVREVSDLCTVISAALLQHQLEQRCRICCGSFSPPVCVSPTFSPPLAASVTRPFFC
jgi:hypothetical protein